MNASYFLNKLPGVLNLEFIFLNMKYIGNQMITGEGG